MWECDLNPGRQEFLSSPAACKLPYGRGDRAVTNLPSVSEVGTQSHEDHAAILQRPLAKRGRDDGEMFAPMGVAFYRGVFASPSFTMLRPTIMACLVLLIFAELLDTSAEAAMTCPKECNCIEEDHHVLCNARQLSTIPRNLPRETTKLEVTWNNIRRIPEDAFSNLTNLELLHLQGNAISNLPYNALQKLPELTFLVLSENHLRDFPWGAIKDKVELTQLSLNNNQLSSVPPNALKTLRNLQRLSLEDNQFSTFPTDFFRGLPSLTRLTLHNNPLNCSCGMRWLKTWVLANMDKVPKAKQIECAWPPHLKGRRLVEVNFTCQPPPIFVYPREIIVLERYTTAAQCIALGEPKPSISWVSPDRQVIGTSKGRIRSLGAGVLLLNRVSIEDKGTYTCVASTPGGSSVAHVVVKVQTMTSADAPQALPSSTLQPPTVPQNGNSLKDQKIQPISVRAENVSPYGANILVTSNTSYNNAGPLRVYYRVRSDKLSPGYTFLLKVGVRNYTFQEFTPSTEYIVCMSQKIEPTLEECVVFETLAEKKPDYTAYIALAVCIGSLFLVLIFSGLGYCCARCRIKKRRGPGGGHHHSPPASHSRDTDLNTGISLPTISQQAHEHMIPPPNYFTKYENGFVISRSIEV
ncbi:axonoproteinsis [Branchiostoma belcheri]|nr:axonoproteinsis [Branchiostoma belcheri]